jgi:hypothetical protein
VPLNSVQQYVKSVVNGITVTGQTQPLVAYVTPPVIDNVGGAPKAYVWAGRLEPGRRQTTPRGPGFKELNWLIDVYLNYETNPNRPNVGGVAVDNQFPLIVDAVFKAFWTTTMPTFIDANGVAIGNTPSPGATQITHIGESFRLDYPVERTPATLRMLWYSAMMTIDVQEIVQA